MPEGLEVGAQLFTIYVSDFDEGAKAKISKFSNGTKLDDRRGDEDDERGGYR